MSAWVSRGVECDQPGATAIATSDNLRVRIPRSSRQRIHVYQVFLLRCSVWEVTHLRERCMWKLKCIDNYILQLFTWENCNFSPLFSLALLPHIFALVKSLNYKQTKLSCYFTPTCLLHLKTCLLLIVISPLWTVDIEYTHTYIYLEIFVGRLSAHWYDNRRSIPALSDFLDLYFHDAELFCAR